MTDALRSLLIPALLSWPLHTFAAGKEEIRFNKGEVTGTVRGEVTTTIKTWRFRAQKGQRITVSLTSADGNKSTLTMTLYAYCGEEYGKPLASEALRWEGALPCTDHYTIDVVPGAEAMKQARMQRYTLTLTIR